MEIQEVYRKKAILATQIQELLTKFKEETGVRDVDVDIIHIQAFDYSSRDNVVAGFTVRVTVKL